MELNTANEVMACLSPQRTLFHYYKDRYSLGLLKQLSAKPLTISQLKQSRFGALTQKPRVKQVLSQLGKHTLHASDLNMHDYDAKQTAFTLTLATWGAHTHHWRHKQTSRKGYNLVLQLNLNRQHDSQFAKLGAENDFFNGYSHPTSHTKNTLAWARIDFDWQSNSALVEEIQCDWLRRVLWLQNSCQDKLNQPKASLHDETGYYGLTCPLATSLDYCQQTLAQFEPIWAEAMLWATVDFIANEIGIKHIFYHTPESGKLLKNIHWRQPPASLYSDLPRKFCFERTAEIPDFLQQSRHTHQKLGKSGKADYFQKLSFSLESN